MSKKTVLKGGVSKTNINYGKLLETLGEIIDFIPDVLEPIKEIDYRQVQGLGSPIYDVSSNIQMPKEYKPRDLGLDRRREARRNTQQVQRVVQVEPQKSLTNINNPENKARSISLPNYVSSEDIQMGSGLRNKYKSLLDREMANRIKMQNRADVIYGSDEEYYARYPKINNPVYLRSAGSEIYNPALDKAAENPAILQEPIIVTPITDISNPDKVLFKDGMLGDKLIKTANNQPMNFQLQGGVEFNQKTESDKKEQAENTTNTTQTATGTTKQTTNTANKVNTASTTNATNSTDATTPVNAASHVAPTTEARQMLNDFYVVYSPKQLLLQNQNKIQKILNLIKPVLYADLSEGDLNFIGKVLEINKVLQERAKEKNIKHDVFNINYILENLQQDEIKELLILYQNAGSFSGLLLTDIVGPDVAMVLEVSKPNVDLSKIDSKNAIVYNNPSELPIELQNRVIKKLKSQNLNINSRGILFKSTSGTSQRIKESKEFKNLIYNISFDFSVSNDHLITGKDTSILLTGRNLFFAFKKVDVVDNKIIDNNKFSCYIIDTTDYNFEKDDNLVMAARDLQVKKILEPVFLIIEIEVPLAYFSKPIKIKG